MSRMLMWIDCLSDLTILLCHLSVSPGYVWTPVHHALHILPGALTGWWYTGLRKGLRMFFLAHFWYIDGWVSVTDPMHPICKIGAFWKIWPKKHPTCSKLGVFCSNSDWSQNHTFRGIEMVEILKSTLSIPVQNWRPRALTTLYLAL